MAVAREQAPVAVGRGAEPDRARLAPRARDELLHAVELDPHRPPGSPGQERGDHVDRVEVEAAAEVAADRRLQHAHTAAREAERVGQVALVEERDLGGRPHREAAARVPVGDRRHRAEARLRDERQPVGVLDDRRGLREGPVHVAVAEPVAQGMRVRPQLLVHERRAGRQRRARVEHGGQLRVLDVDQLERRLGGGARLGRDRGDLVADAPDLAPLERRLVPGEAEGPGLDVLARQHGEHARERAGARRVDAHDPSVGEPRAQDPAVGQPRQLEVVEVARAPRRLLGAVALAHRLADDLEGRDHAQNFTGSSCSPKTSFIAWQISPSVA
ncbi:MAG: hypothetical protein A3D33_08035 [Candidatus Rokubacteria bacterium RIFCSPHIGHO2_02_FULL_73_26]|nr:MAG: hypothetical protein A3D33_08035 [Candidatus Rokubacteria bacterium RIFCSPHIGHO2_02_FULL_73_26]